MTEQVNTSQDVNMDKAVKSHEWYHDGPLVSKQGRLCLTCRFREIRDGVADEPCLGSPRLYWAGHQDGYAEGQRRAKDDIARALGLR